MKSRSKQRRKPAPRLDFLKTLRDEFARDAKQFDYPLQSVDFPASHAVVAKLLVGIVREIIIAVDNAIGDADFAAKYGETAKPKRHKKTKAA